MPNPLVVLVVTLAINQNQAPAQNCKPVKGDFTARVVQPCTAPGGVCTEGKLTGGLQGEYGFRTTKDQIPAGAPAPPTVGFFVGESTVTLQNGVKLTGIDTGAIDMPPAQGGFVSLITWKDGGQIRIRGALSVDADGKTLRTAGEYDGTVCGIK